MLEKSRHFGVAPTTSFPYLDWTSGNSVASPARCFMRFVVLGVVVLFDMRLAGEAMYPKKGRGILEHPWRGIFREPQNSKM